MDNKKSIMIVFAFVVLALGVSVFVTYSQAPVGAETAPAQQGSMATQSVSLAADLPEPVATQPANVTPTPTTTPAPASTPGMDLRDVFYVATTVPPLFPKLRYTFAQAWPPETKIQKGEVICADVGYGIAPGTEMQRISVEGRPYCVISRSEGAAGHTYTTYVYTTQRGDYVAAARFTVNALSCGVYDEPGLSECREEQKNRATVDALIDRYLQSLTWGKYRWELLPWEKQRDGIPRFSVQLWDAAGKAHSVGVFAGECAADDSGNLLNELSSVICRNGNLSRKIGVFKEGGDLVVKEGELLQSGGGSGDSPFRSEPKILLILK